MARPTRFTTSQFLDAAVRRAATAGPAGVTMSAVAGDVGAPSGSVYHRFAGRSALLAETWLRTVESFQEGYLAALASDAPGAGTGTGTGMGTGTGTEADARRAGRAAARHVVAWSRAHPQETALLLHGAEEFGRADWSEEHISRADSGNQRVCASVAALATALGVHGPQATERVVLALIDLPLSLVRRHVRAGTPLPSHAEDLAEQCAAALLDERER